MKDSLMISQKSNILGVVHKIVYSNGNHIKRHRMNVKTQLEAVDFKNGTVFATIMNR
jgi:hypothetical protein